MALSRRSVQREWLGLLDQTPATESIGPEENKCPTRRNFAKCIYEIKNVVTLRYVSDDPLKIRIRIRVSPKQKAM